MLKSQDCVEISRCVDLSHFRQWVTKPPFRSYNLSKCGHRPKTGSITKIRALTNWSDSANLGPIILKRIEHGVQISKPMFYSFQIDQTKIGGVTLILYGLFTTQQMSKRGLTSAGRKPAFKTPYTPFPIHILNRVDMRIRHVSYKIYHTYKKIEKIAIEWSVFGDLWGLI